MRILSGAAAAKQVGKIAARGSRYEEVEPVVRRIIADVRKQGDRALRKYAERWDGLPPRESVRVSEREIQAAWKAFPSELKTSLRTAAANIRRFCEWQKPVEWTCTRQGITVGQIARPLDSVGCYVPGGRYPLVSTLLMTVIPAQVAGVQHIRVISPQPRAEILAAAGMLGVREVYRVGGAQAIAAVAYGTQSIPRVDKVVGPGNLYVTAAKKLIAFDCAIDFLAGPTEVVIVSDTGTPEFIAADLVAQAEHDPDAISLFVTTSTRLGQAVAAEIEQQLAELPRTNLARRSLARNGAVLVAKNLADAAGFVNRFAPEHLSLPGGADGLLDRIESAGSIFLGDWSAQSFGDYASGTNHVLPTGGVARTRGGLSVSDFVKCISVQEVSRAGVRRLAPVVAEFARAEGLAAHARSVEVRK